PAIAADFPVGGVAKRLPWCVPRNVMWCATRSPSATSSSIVTCKSGKVRRQCLEGDFEARWTAFFASAGGMIDEVGRDELVGERAVALIERLLDEMHGGGLVLCDRHDTNSWRGLTDQPGEAVRTGGDARPERSRSESVRGDEA